MTKRKQLSESEPIEELSKLDLRIAGDMRKRSADVLRTLQPGVAQRTRFAPSVYLVHALYPVTRPGRDDERLQAIQARSERHMDVHIGGQS